MKRTIEQRHGIESLTAGGGELRTVNRRRPERRDEFARPAEVRCQCGSLMARLVGNQIELKCRRCKRVVTVATDRASQGWVAVPGGGCGP